MNSEKTESTFLFFFSQDGDISTLKGKPLKLVNNSYNLVVISHLLKVMSTYLYVKHGLLLIS